MMLSQMEHIVVPKRNDKHEVGKLLLHEPNRKFIFLLGTRLYAIADYNFLSAPERGDLPGGKAPGSLRPRYQQLRSQKDEGIE